MGLSPTRNTTVFLEATLRRYFFSFHPEVGDPSIAGGAVDQYVSAGAGVQFDVAGFEP